MSSLTKLLKEFKSLIILIVLFLIVGAGAWYGRGCVANKENDLLKGANSELVKDLEVTKNRTLSIETLLESGDEEANFLRQLIANMEESPAEIRYVVETKTVIKGTPPKEIFIEVEKTCPAPQIPSYTYRWESGMPVASFNAEATDGGIRVKHETADIDFQGNIVVSEGKSAISLRGKSTLEPEKTYTIPVDTISTVKIREHKLFEPHIAVIVQGSLETSPVDGDVTAGLSVPLVHLLDKQLDFIAPKGTFNHKSFRVGLDIVGYNIGHDLPIITDTWLSLGTSVSLTDGNYYPSIDITIGSKF